MPVHLLAGDSAHDCSEVDHLPDVPCFDVGIFTSGRNDGREGLVFSRRWPFAFPTQKSQDSFAARSFNHRRLWSRRGGRSAANDEQWPYTTATRGWLHLRASPFISHILSSFSRTHVQQTSMVSIATSSLTGECVWYRSGKCVRHSCSCWRV